MVFAALVEGFDPVYAGSIIIVGEPYLDREYLNVK